MGKQELADWVLKALLERETEGGAPLSLDALLARAQDSVLFDDDCARRDRPSQTPGSGHGG